MKSVYKILPSLLFFLLFWQSIISMTSVPNYFLPSPLQVMHVMVSQAPLLFSAGLTTLLEASLGFLLAFILGVSAAFLCYYSRLLGFLFWPLLLVSQALPMLAIAPLLILWLGYGLVSKIILVTIFLFFPICSAFLDGLKRTPFVWFEMARLMTQSKFAIFWRIQLPAALASLGSGLRIAAANALMSAVIGEWVGASQGLGFLLLGANARFETALVFSIVVLISLLSLLFFWLVSYLLKRWITW